MDPTRNIVKTLRLAVEVIRMPRSARSALSEQSQGETMRNGRVMTDMAGLSKQIAEQREHARWSH